MSDFNAAERDALLQPAALRPENRGGALLSDHWFRVAYLCPRLAPDVQLERIAYRGEAWVTLQASTAEATRRVRLNPAAYAFFGRCNGNASMQVLWQWLLAERQDDAPTQDELLHLLLQLHQGGFAVFDHVPDFGLLTARRTDNVKPPPSATPLWKSNWLAIRLPLGNPDAALQKLLPLGRAVFSPLGLALWLAVVGAGLTAAAFNLAAIADFLTRWMGTPHVLWMTWMVFPWLKALHEAAHGVAVKRYGGTVPQWGITLMALTPAPFVDASAADAFALPRQRLAVSAAGAMVELFMASLALGLALALQPGLLRDFCWVVFVTGAISSIVINANPLLRFDGYHALTDMLELPNLAQRSSRHWLWLWQRAVGITPAALPDAARGERVWWWLYAPASWACRALMALTLIAWAGAASFALGMALVAYFGHGMLLTPALRALRFLSGVQLEAKQARRARFRAFAAAGAVTLLMLALPLPNAAVARGVVWLPEQAMVRAETAGFVEQALVRDGQAVQAGDLMFVLSDPSLAVDKARLEGLLVKLQTERIERLANEPARAQRLSSEMAAQQAALDRVLQRMGQLELRAASAGTLSVARAQDWPGRHVAQGTVLAYVIPNAPDPSSLPMTVRVALEPEQAALLRSQSRAVSVRLPHLDALPAQLLRDPTSDSTATVTQLPSAALGERYGGDIVTLPTDNAGRKSDSTAARAVVLLDVQVAHAPARSAQQIGARAWVRFDQGSQPWGWTLAQRAQQAVLMHFSPAS
jgi:putative peptide zinc metalloprotease protein